jgi:putative redox protein
MSITGKVIWNEDLQFGAVTGTGHELALDSMDGSTGPAPKELMVLALGGCTGMDVISILQKMQQDVTRFEVEVVGDTAEEHPRRYIAFTVTYHLHGSDIEPEKVARAITLSRDKYCMVGWSIDPATPKTYLFTINDGAPQEVPEAGPDTE